MPSSTGSRDSRTWSSVSTSFRARFAGVGFSGVMRLPSILRERCPRFGFHADGLHVPSELVGAHLREVFGPRPSHPSEETPNGPIRRPNERTWVIGS
jgi:hypothetical protein